MISKKWKIKFENKIIEQLIFCYFNIRNFEISKYRSFYPNFDPHLWYEILLQKQPKKKVEKIHVASVKINESIWNVKRKRYLIICRNNYCFIQLLNNFYELLLCKINVLFFNFTVIVIERKFWAEMYAPWILKETALKKIIMNFLTKSY